MQHTPGPWKVETENVEVASKPISIIHVTKGSYKICQVLLPFATHETHELAEIKLANARLIAAAPELLEAAKIAQRELFEEGRVIPILDLIINLAEGK